MINSVTGEIETNEDFFAIFEKYDSANGVEELTA